MKTQKSVKTVLLFLAAATIGFVVWNADGGNLEPSAPPGPTGHTLEEIYNAVRSLQPQPQESFFDVFVRIDGIPGESRDAAHKDWIEVIGFTWGQHKASHLAAPEMEDIVITKYLDKATPILAEACCKGQHIPEVILEVCRSTGDKQKYMEYRLKDVIVSSVSGQSRRREETSGGVPSPIEEVSLNYQKISWTYIPADGNSITTCWDVIANAPLCPVAD